jgi:putative transcriptional regulator
MVLLYNKDEMSDVSTAQAKQLAQLLRHEIAARTHHEKHDLFAELKAGFDERAAARAGKTTLRTVQVEAADPVLVSAQELKAVREALHLSQAVMARRLRANDRTYQNWQQGKSRPNAQAALLIKLVEKYPETLERLAAH